MATVLAVMNQKGGVLKTSTVQSITDYLRTMGKTLIVDLDQQDNQKAILGVRNTDRDASMTGILLEDFNPFECVHKCRKNVDLITSGGKRLEKFTEKYSKLENNETILETRLAQIDQEYDFIVIDSNPTFTLIHANIIHYADFIISPADMDMLSLASTRSTLHFIESLLKRTGGVGDKYLGIIPIKFDKRRNTDNLILDQFYELEHNGLLHGGTIFQSIRESSKVKTSQTRRKFLTETYPNEKITQDQINVSRQVYSEIQARLAKRGQEITLSRHEQTAL